MDVSVLKSLLDAGLSLVFLYLFIRSDTRLWQREDSHDQEMRQVNDARVQDLKHLKTDLSGDYSTPAKTA